MPEFIEFLKSIGLPAAFILVGILLLLLAELFETLFGMKLQSRRRKLASWTGVGLILVGVAWLAYEKLREPGTIEEFWERDS